MWFIYIDIDMCLHVYMYIYVYIYTTYIYTHMENDVKRGPQHQRGYGVATVSRIDKIICLFCGISSLL